MKKVIVTGSSGTVGSALCGYLESEDVEVIAWDRSLIPIDDYWAMETFMKREQPDALFHLAIASQPQGQNDSWRVNYRWPSELAWLTRQLNVSFVFTSTVMVFEQSVAGPYTPMMTPVATDGYGYEKRMAEERVLYQNPDTVIARLGWQIGDAAGSNNMIDFLVTRQEREGEIRASKRWKPACSFLQDTVAALTDLVGVTPGTYHVDSNPKWNFYEIATALNEKHGNLWNIVPTEDFVYDQRMIDPRVEMPPLSYRLPSLN